MTDALSRLAVALADRYTIERELGQGGMATVYLAQDLKHNRKVAVKVLKPELSAVIGGERFVQEIEVTANLQHPNILPLYDSGTATADDGQATFLYYVMPFVEGESLRDRIDRERQLPVDESVAIARSVTAALDYAHRHDVVHRDIKPENILLHDGQALVADFGIALAVSAAGGQRMTETGMSIGTPHYMSPEQASADRELDGRTDVYSLGATLYEMLTGEPPFTGASAQSIVAKILTEPAPSVTKERALVPDNVDAAIQRSLAKLPADRFQSAADFGAALGNATFAMPGTRPAIRAAAAGSRSLVPALGAALVVVGALAVWGWQREATAPLYRFAVSFPEGEELQGVPTRRFALSPNGDRLAYVGPGGAGNVRGIWVREMENLNARPVPGTDLPRSVFFAPDGRSVGFVDGEPGNLKTVPVDGGPVRVVATEINPWGVSWAPDGWIYFTFGGGRLGRVRAEGGKVDTIAGPDSTDLTRGFEYDWPEAMPNGKGLVFQVWSGGIATSELAVLRLDTREVRTLTPGVVGKYHPSGILLYVTVDGTLFARAFDQDRMEFEGEAVPVESGVRVEGFAGVAQFDVARNGTIVYQPGGSGTEDRIVRVDRQGTATPVDPDWRGGFQYVALSPDGSLLGVAASSATGVQIWVKELDTGPERLLTFEGGANNRPAWEPDSRHLLYLGDGQRLWRARADGGAVGVEIPVSGPLPWEAQRSRDGEWLILRAGGTGTGTRDIVAMREGVDTVPRMIVGSPFDEYAPDLSPNGRWIAYVSSETTREEVYVRPFPDAARAKIRVSGQGGTEPRWSRDGRELFLRNARGELVVHAVREVDDALEVGQGQVLFDASGYLSDNYHRTYDVSLDGQSFYMIAPSESSGGDLVVVLNGLEEVLAKVEGR